VEIKSNEMMIMGEIVEHPICMFSNLNDGGNTLGFVYLFRTTQFIGYEYKEVDIWIKSIFDVRKWDIIKKGQKLTLSILQKEKSKYSPELVVLKCNIVNRTF
jgi:hypothetical protein